jgi:endonuclease-3
MLTLAKAVDALATASPGISFPDDPFRLIVYENAGALVDDVRRRALFDRIIAAGPTPAKLLRADRKKLMAIALDGGMRPETRVDRWYEIARIILDEADGDLLSRLRELQPKARRTLLKKFPVIGEPGIDKVLLFCNVEAVPSADSNVLRVFERLNLVPPGDYTKQYRIARDLQQETYGGDAPALKRAYHALRDHGKTLCRRAAPDHARCPVARYCTGGSSH